MNKDNVVITLIIIFAIISGFVGFPIGEKIINNTINDEIKKNTNIGAGIELIEEPVIITEGREIYLQMIKDELASSTSDFLQKKVGFGATVEHFYNTSRENGASAEEALNMLVDEYIRIYVKPKKVVPVIEDRTQEIINSLSIIKEVPAKEIEINLFK